VITKARLTESGEEVAVKTCLDETGRPSGAVARTQFDSLRQVHSRMPDPMFTVVRPIDVDQAEGLLIIEWIDGVPLTGRLLAHAFSPKDRARLCERAGRWLRAFHDAHPLPAGPIDLDAKTEAVRRLLATGAVTSPMFATAARTLLATANDTMSIELPRSWVCGDFKPDNVLINDRSVVGLDVTVTFENVVLHDLASFLNHLDLDLLSPRRAVLWVSRRRTREAFLGGYRFDLTDARAKALSWVCLFHLLHVWRQLEAANTGGLRSMVIRLALNRLCRPLLRDLSPS
jgi:Ser/Thr protein kinase RdoA (MazF antagonist)